MQVEMKTASDLSVAECGALLTLGLRGASASFDQEAMSHLFVDGMIEVSNANRRVVLTQQGGIAYAYLTAHQEEIRPATPAHVGPATCQGPGPYRHTAYRDRDSEGAMRRDPAKPARIGPAIYDGPVPGSRHNPQFGIGR